jgi:hypothetical protein
VHMIIKHIPRASRKVTFAQLDRAPGPKWVFSDRMAPPGPLWSFEPSKEGLFGGGKD